MEAFTTAMGVPGFVLLDLGTLAVGQDAHRLLGLRYLIANREVWRAHFGWQRPLEAARPRALLDDERVQELLSAAEGSSRGSGDARGDHACAPRRVRSLPGGRAAPGAEAP